MDPTTPDHERDAELSAEELDLVAGGLPPFPSLPAQPSEDEPFDPGSYTVPGAG